MTNNTTTTTTTKTNYPEPPQDHQKRPLPKRIILVRHGKSQGNVDETLYATTPDHNVPLTKEGMDQAKQAGNNILDVISEKGESKNWNVYFYVSPYKRTLETLKGIREAFPVNRVIGSREECRMREQDFGNFQDPEKMKQFKETKLKFGRFFYRFPQGESGADVYDRVSSFLESLWRDIDMNRFSIEHSTDLNLVIVSHGLAIRIFLMRWFKWTVEQFELIYNPRNSECIVMELGYDGEYSLAIHHNEEKLKQWGLNSEMIEDQKWLAYGPQGDIKEKKMLYREAFFDHYLAEADEIAKEDDA